MTRKVEMGCADVSMNARESSIMRSIVEDSNSSRSYSSEPPTCSWIAIADAAVGG